MKRFTDTQWIELTKVLIPLFNDRNLRTGQSYMIALNEVDQKMYNEITNTENDPFYDDEKVITLIRYLNEEL